MGLLDAPALSKTQGDARYPQISPAGRDQLESAAGIAMMPWHTALGNAANGLAKWLQIGDSHTEGYSASTARKRYASIAADIITARYPVGNTATLRGGTFRPCFWYGATAGNNSIAAPAALIAGPGTPGVDSTFGFGRRAAHTTADGQGYTWTETCTSFDVCWVQGPATGTLGVTVDGGAELTFSTTGSLTSGKRWNSSTNGSLPLTAGSHTIRVRQVGAGNCYVTGLMLYTGNETTGVQVVESGHFGWKTSDWTTNNTYFPAEVQVFQPHLVTIQLGTNDYQANVASATYLTQMQTLISQIRAVLTKTASFALIAPHTRGDVAAPAEPWANYITAMKTIAATDTGGIGGASGVAFIDLSRRLPTPGSTGAGDPLGLITSDRVHFTDLAGGMLANAIVAGISPR